MYIYQRAFLLRTVLQTNKQSKIIMKVPAALALTATAAVAMPTGGNPYLTAVTQGIPHPTLPTAWSAETIGTYIHNVRMTTHLLHVCLHVAHKRSLIQFFLVLEERA